MGANTKIEWCDHTHNLWMGCSKVHAGCKNCYAETWASRWQKPIWGNSNPRQVTVQPIAKLKNLQRQAADRKAIETVFVGSLMDIFEEPKGMIKANGEMAEGDTGKVRTSLFLEINAKSFPNLVFLLLTKRPENILKYVPQSWRGWPPENVWFGMSPVNQETYDQMMIPFREIPGNKFLSIEPQLGDIGLGNRHPGVQWIIQGGESGRSRRPFDMNWQRSLERQCKHWDIPYFFKQIDKVQKVPQHLIESREFPDFR